MQYYNLSSYAWVHYLTEGKLTAHQVQEEDICPKHAPRGNAWFPAVQACVYLHVLVSLFYVSFDSFMKYS